MVPILVVIEATAVFTNLAALGITNRFENVPWLEEDLTSVLVDLFEPVSQFLVSVGVVVQRIDRILDLVHAPAIGKPFEKRPQFAGGLLKSRILATNVDHGFGQSTAREKPT